MKKINLITIAALAMFAMTSCCNEPQVKNVIYLIGDGMGFGAVTSLLLTEDEPTGFEQAPVIGLSETCSANNYVTDSAAGGTALATGTRTNNGYVGADPEGNQLTSVLRKAQTYGMKTGIVVNTTLTEATPGAFYAGVTDRDETFTIAQQFTESNMDIAIGAGFNDFINRPDSVDLTAVLIDKGYDVYLNWNQVVNTQSEKFVALLQMSDVHRPSSLTPHVASADDGAKVCLAARLAAAEIEGDTTRFAEPEVYLEKACTKALQQLEKNAPKGFFLMVEGALIDGFEHNNYADGLIEEMHEFDRVLKTLIAYVNTHPNTLLVVTADHETGGTCIRYKKHPINQPEGIEIGFISHGHTGTVVPVFAYGAGAEKFAGIFKNKELPGIIEELIK
jgi:alkaline phosphatase